MLAIDRSLLCTIAADPHKNVHQLHSVTVSHIFIAAKQIHSEPMRFEHHDFQQFDMCNSKGSAQLAHMRSLIRAFANHLNVL